MDIHELARELEQGAYQGLDISEYAFARRFCELTQPQTITVVGGSHNLDLFYAVQECRPTVTNWDPGNTGMGHTIRAQHDRFKEITSFKGEYQWIQQTVNDLDTVKWDVDLMWLNCMPSDPFKRTEWPPHIIFTHNGDLTQAGVVMQIHKHRPLIALGRRMAVFSSDTHDWSHPTYKLRSDRHLGPINPVQEILR